MNSPSEPVSDGADSRLTCDLLVVGSGAGGLSAAVTAARLGLKVIVVEKEAQVGGTSAWSGGWMWIPGNPLARAAGAADDAEASRIYLRHELGAGYDEARIETYLTQGPRMVDFFRNEIGVEFINGPSIPDFHGKAPGAALGNRAICAAPFDGRALGARVALLKPPLDLLYPFGMGIATLEYAHFVNFLRRRQSFVHVARRMLRHVYETVRYGRGLYLVNGNALVARLLKSAFDLGVEIRTSTCAASLVLENGAVAGARVRSSGRDLEVRAARGVVLAGGGFPHDVQRRAGLFPHAPTGQEHWSAAPRTNTGDGVRLGESVGARVRTDYRSPAVWIPVSLVPLPDGTAAHFPHLGMDRGKPGSIMVLSSGKRFCNEADSYHDVVAALLDATRPGDRPQAWMLCDHRFLRRWGLGRVRPFPFPIGPWRRNGYLKRGKSMADLARVCDIDPAALARTIERFNEAARRGVDPEFHRGETAFNLGYGDPECKPNASLAPLESGPFYAIRIVPGSLSTVAGLAADAGARVLDREGRPIPKLFAAGNDLASIAAGTYPSGGLCVGPAMVFGFIAAHGAGGVPLDGRG